MDTGPEVAKEASKNKETGTASNAKPRPKGYTNPALQALGIPRIRIPSRNWSIFWAVTFSIVGAWGYDRRERKRIRQQWKDRVSYLAEQHMNPLDMPRKVTVFIAPPPADYLDLGFAHFRQYIKPILVAAAIDYEVKSENRQGEIRALVAEEIRNKRRADLGLSTTVEPTDELDDAILSKVRKDTTGGVICIGRGAYKEYINGLHEGWLGPLEAPEKIAENEIAQHHEAQHPDEPVFSDNAITPKTLDETTKSETVFEEFPDKERDMRDIYGELPHEDDKQDKNNGVSEESDVKKEEEPKKKPVSKPYVKIGDYGDIEAPAQLETLAEFEPISAISFPHLMGFLNAPRRLYRFFTKRHLADKMGASTAAVVFGNTRPFNIKEDVDLLREEEDDWPTKWKQKGIETGSEWMLNFDVDERIGNKINVYELQDESKREEF